MKKILCVSFLGLVLNGCSVVGGVASDVIGGAVGNAMNALTDKSIEVSEDIKKTAVIEGAKWRQPSKDLIAYGFTVSPLKNCKGITFEGKAYRDDVVVGTLSSFGVQGLTDVQANSKVFVSKQIVSAGGTGVSRLTLDKLNCVN